VTATRLGVLRLENRFFVWGANRDAGRGHSLLSAPR
jgi:hypothetical protein